MALQVTTLQRVFEFKKGGQPLKLDDPNPEMSAEDVRKFYSGKYPELTNAIIEGPTVVGDKATYVMATKAGKLG